MKSILIRYSLALLAILGFGAFSFVLLPLTLYTSFFLLKIFTEVSLAGNTITVSSVPFTFIPACAATIAYLLLLTLILFTRGISLQKGMKMFFLGAIMIFCLNILRITLLILIYINYGKNYFDAIHIVFWHFVSSIFVAGVWIFLIEYYKIQNIPIVSDIKEMLK